MHCICYRLERIDGYVLRAMLQAANGLTVQMCLTRKLLLCPV